MKFNVFSLIVLSLLLFNTPAKASHKKCHSVTSGELEVKKFPKRRSLSKQAYFLILKEIYNSAGINFSRSSTRGAEFSVTWKQWSEFAKTHMSSPGVFNKKLSAQAALFLNKSGLRTQEQGVSVFKPNQNFPENLYFFLWAASMPEIFVSFLNKRGVGEYKSHHGPVIREIIWLNQETIEGQNLLLSALVQGLKRTFVEMHMENQEYQNNITLPVLYKNFEKAILDSFNRDYEPDLSENDFAIYGDIYSNYELGRNLPKSSTHRLHDRADNYYSTLETLNNYVQQASSHSRQLLFNENSPSFESSIPMNQLSLSTGKIKKSKPIDFPIPSEAETNEGDSTHNSGYGYIEPDSMTPAEQRLADIRNNRKIPLDVALERAEQNIARVEMTRTNFVEALNRQMDQRHGTNQRKSHHEDVSPPQPTEKMDANTNNDPNENVQNLPEASKENHEKESSSDAPNHLSHGEVLKLLIQTGKEKNQIDKSPTENSERENGLQKLIDKLENDTLKEQQGDSLDTQPSQEKIQPEDWIYDYLTQADINAIDSLRPQHKNLETNNSSTNSLIESYENMKEIFIIWKEYWSNILNDSSTQHAKNTLPIFETDMIQKIRDLSKMISSVEGPSSGISKPLTSSENKLIIKIYSQSDSIKDVEILVILLENELARLHHIILTYKNHNQSTIIRFHYRSIVHEIYEKEISKALIQIETYLNQLTLLTSP